MINKINISKIEKNDILIMRCGGRLVAEADASYSQYRANAYYVPIKDSKTALHITKSGKVITRDTIGKKTPNNPFDIIGIIKQK